jgi:hypothetical protein
VGRGHREHVVGFADRGLLAVELLAVPAGDAACLVGLDGGVRDVFLAEHDVGLGRRLVQRLPLGFGIGNVVEAVRDVVGRAIVLVEAAATLEDGRRLAGRGRGFRSRCLAGLGRRSRTGPEPPQAASRAAMAAARARRIIS